MNLPLVINPEQLTADAAASLKIIDLRAAEAYAEAHLPGAHHLETSFLNRSEQPVGGLLPDIAGVNALAAAIGLQADDHVLAYDNGGGSAAARFVWVMHAYGFNNISWLNGGFGAWQAAQRPVDTSTVALRPSNATLQFKPGNVLSVDEMQTQLDNADIAVLDVRSAAEYDGSDVRSARGGHVPNAIHSEWTNAFDESGKLKDDATLKALYSDIGVTDDKHVVVYCQTHQRSALTYVVLKHLGYENVSAIDGAWSAWGNDPNVPIETGPSSD